MILISLIGEQPIPNLLPALHLQPTENILIHTGRTKPVALRLGRILPNARLEDLTVSPYDIAKATERIWGLLPAGQEVGFNLTGGTKPMIMAAYQVAAQNGCPVYYLESERHRSLLYEYPVSAGKIAAHTIQEIRGHILIEDYLRAHLDNYTVEGFHRDETTQQLDSGGLFEQAVYHVVRNAGYEVLAGIRPDGVARQLEIDLMIRRGNVFGIAEIKLGDKKGDSWKRGMDQLTNVGGREYLGTYTEKFLIAGRWVDSRAKTLAQARAIHIIELPEYQTGSPLSASDQQRLISQLQSKFS